MLYVNQYSKKKQVQMYAYYTVDQELTGAAVYSRGRRFVFTH